MKVAFATPYANFLVGGGLNTQILQTMKHLSPFGIEANHFAPWEHHNSTQLNLIHIFHASMTTHDLALHLKNLKVPFVVSTVFYTLHNPWFLRFSQKLQTFSKKIFKGIWTNYGIIENICQASRAVLPNTSAEARLIEKGLGIPAHKIQVIPNGVEKRFYHAEPDLFVKKYGLKNFILNVGNIGSLRKNALSLIRALSTIDHPAVIIGKVYQNEYAEKCLEEAARNKNLLIIDGLPHDSPLLESAYAACDVFTLPSYFETPGIATMEAALARSKIVITPHGGTRDYFKDEAVYVDHLSSASIARGIEDALNQPFIPELRERIYNHYLWEHIARQTAAVYRRISEV